MYSKPFYITEPVGNNAFSFKQRENKKIYVPSLKKISCLDNIQLGEEVAFEDFGFDDALSTNKWLKNFYELEWNWKKIYLFDNHNHAYFFWYLARDKWIIWDNNTLIHIDEHADMRDPWEYLMKPESLDLDKVFHYTNYVYNVGNYIIPARQEWIIWEIIQIRSEAELLEYIQSPPPNLPHNKGEGLDLRNNQDWWIILNLDLDFFQKDLDFIDYELKKKVVFDAAMRAKVITVATSPFFIDQKSALEVFHDIFG